MGTICLFHSRTATNSDTEKIRTRKESSLAIPTHMTNSDWECLRDFREKKFPTIIIWTLMRVYRQFLLSALKSPRVSFSNTPIPAARLLQNPLKMHFKKHGLTEIHWQHLGELFL